MDVIASEIVQKYRVFSIRRMLVRGPRGSEEFHVVERPDSVQVIAVTENGQLLMVEQERHGTLAMSLEFVAGLIDEGEAPEQAAARELEEETGYRASQLRRLGWYHTDPAVMTNKVTVFLAEGCRASGRQQQDVLEDVRPRLVAAEELPRMIEDGTITHALCVAAWQLYQSRVQRSRSRT